MRLGGGIIAGGVRGIRDLLVDRLEIARQRLRRRRLLVALPLRLRRDGNRCRGEDGAAAKRKREGELRTDGGPGASARGEWLAEHFSDLSW